MYVCCPTPDPLLSICLCNVPINVLPPPPRVGVGGYLTKAFVYRPMVGATPSVNIPYIPYLSSLWGFDTSMQDLNTHYLTSIYPYACSYDQQMIDI